jgi:predicted chitinase
MHTRTKARSESTQQPSSTPAPNRGLLQLKSERPRALEDAPGMAAARQGFGPGHSEEPPGRLPPVVGEVLSAPGQPLEPEVRAGMESQLGHDFGHVRVHADARAAQSARAVGAQAYTVGERVVFGAGKYQPSTRGGKHLLAHELTHVVQQTAGEVPGASFSEAATEAEADRNAAAAGSSFAASSGGEGVQLRARPGVIQRQPQAQQQQEPLDDEARKILRAAQRAKGEPGDHTLMVIRGAEITYRIIGKYLPTYADKIGGVGYGESTSGVTAKKWGRDSITVTVGKDFILNTDADTLKAHAAQVEQALKSTGVAPTPAAAADAKTDEAAAAEKPIETAQPPAAATQKALVAPQGKWSKDYGNRKNYVGTTYEDYKGGLGELKATTKGGLRGGVAGRGTLAAPEISLAVLEKAYPGMAADAAANPERKKKAEAYLKSLNQAFKIMKIDTVEAQANYLAHAYIESDQFRQFTETQGWLNAAKDPSKRADQKWVDKPGKLRLNTDYLETTYNPTIPTGPEKDEEEWVTARRRKKSVNPGGKFEFIGRGPVQVTHSHNYLEVIAMLEQAVEHYEREAKGGNAEALEYAALAREASNAIKADPQQAANPKYAFLVSAAYMKRTRADVSVANITPDEKWTGSDPGSSWVAGVKQTQKPQVAALKEKKAAYWKILPLLMCEAKKAGIEVDKKYAC